MKKLDLIFSKIHEDEYGKIQAKLVEGHEILLLSL